MEANEPKSGCRIGCLGLLGVGLLLGFALLWTPASPGIYGYSAYCKVCGLQRSTQENQAPFTRTTLLSSSEDTQTAYSTAYVEAGGPVHEHDFLFSGGSGNGVRCAIGEGRHQERGARDAGRVELLEFVLRREANPAMQRVYAEQLLVLQGCPVLDEDDQNVPEGERPGVLCWLDKQIAQFAFEASEAEQVLAFEEGLRAFLDARAAK